MRPSQPSWGMARVEVETTQDNMEDLSWEKDDDNLLCGVLGEVETALGSSILVLAVSGPDYTTNDDDKDDSKQQTGELFATSSQMSLGHPVLGLDVPPCPRQQHGSTKQLYLCATQLNNTASAAQIGMEAEKFGKNSLMGGGVKFFSTKSQFQFWNFKDPGAGLNFSKMSEFQLFDGVVCNITFIRNV